MNPDSMKFGTGAESIESSDIYTVEQLKRNLEARANEIGLARGKKLVLIVTPGKTLYWYWHYKRCCKKHLEGAVEETQLSEHNDVTKWFYGLYQQIANKEGRAKDKIGVVKDDKADIFVEWRDNKSRMTIWYRKLLVQRDSQTESLDASSASTTDDRETYEAYVDLRESFRGESSRCEFAMFSSAHPSPDDAYETFYNWTG